MLKRLRLNSQEFKKGEEVQHDQTCKFRLLKPFSIKNNSSLSIELLHGLVYLVELT